MDPKFGDLYNSVIRRLQPKYCFLSNFYIKRLSTHYWITEGLRLSRPGKTDSGNVLVKHYAPAICLLVA